MNSLDSIAKKQLFSLINDENIKCENIQLTSQNGRIAVTATFICTEPKEKEERPFYPQHTPFA